MIFSPVDQVSTWRKLGMVYSTCLNPDWGKSHALVPTFLGNVGGLARIGISFVNSDFQGRLGWVDLAIEGPRVSIQGISSVPLVNLGSSGFAKDGVGFGCVFNDRYTKLLFYVGFERRKDIKFRAFSDVMPLETWQGLTPPREPRFAENELGGGTIVGIHSVISMDDEVFVFFAQGHEFTQINGVLKPMYETRVAHGRSIEELTISPRPCVKNNRERYRVGRPRVFPTKDGFEMLVTVGDRSGSYFPEVYQSSDLLTWTKSGRFPIPLGAAGEFDSTQLCYPDRFIWHGHNYIVYNGNEMGKFGFGIAIGD